VHSVARLAYERGSAGYSHAPQPRQGGTGTWRCLDSKRRARASQTRNLSLLRMASEESEADAAACPLVVAQGEPSWSEVRPMTVLVKCDVCWGGPLAATRAHSYHGNARQHSTLTTGGAPLSGLCRCDAGGTSCQVSLGPSLRLWTAGCPAPLLLVKSEQ
jgi:hypothetical protein